MRFLFLLILVLIATPTANAAVGRHTQTALASRDIGEFENLSEENLISEEGYQQYRGCVSTRRIARGRTVRPEDIACLGPNT